MGPTTTDKETLLLLCMVENSDYPGEFTCMYKKGHDPILDEEGRAWEHADPDGSGAWWND